MKTYTYQVFLRCPHTHKVQYGTVQFDSDGEFRDFKELVHKLSLDSNMKVFREGYTLIGMNVVECFFSWGEIK